MGSTVRVTMNIEVKPKTSKKIKDQIIEELNECFLPTESFDGNIMYCQKEVAFANWGLDQAQHFKLPSKFNKHLICAEMNMTYLEQAPYEQFNLVEDEDE